MKFRDLTETVTKNYKAYTDALRASERRWRLTDTLTIDIRPSSWGADGVCVSLFLRNGDYGSEVRFGDLSHKDILRVAMVRQYVDRWIAGEIDELPVDEPREIVDLAADLS